MKLQKAKIIVLDNVDGRVRVIESETEAPPTVKQPEGEVITVMYNPTEYTLSWSANLPQDENNKLQFNNSKRDNLTVNLFFDSYEEKEDVRTVKNGTNAILKLMEAKVSGKNKRPKICLFIWGGVYYKGIVQKVDQKFTMFLADGSPVRAELTVTFVPYIDNKEQEDNSSLTNSRKFWTITSSDRLELIADSVLGSPDLWREIARENKIINPRKFPEAEQIGKTLIIPHV